jgi:hypothetical protein
VVMVGLTRRGNAPRRDNARPRGLACGGGLMRWQPERTEDGGTAGGGAGSPGGSSCWQWCGAARLVTRKVLF